MNEIKQLERVLKLLKARELESEINVLQSNKRLITLQIARLSKQIKTKTYDMRLAKEIEYYSYARKENVSIGKLILQLTDLIEEVQVFKKKYQIGDDN